MTELISVMAMVGWGLAVLGVIMTAMAISRSNAPRKLAFGLIIAGVLSGSLLTIVNAGLIEVQPNEVSVVFRRLGGDADSLLDQPLGPGLHWVIPFIDAPTIYSTSRQTVDMLAASNIPGRSAVVALTRDGQQVSIDATVIFAIDPARVNEVHKRWQQGYVDGLVVPAVREEIRNAIAGMSVEEVYQNRGSLPDQIEETLRPRLEDEGFLLIDVILRNITFSQEFVAAIEAKQVAEQEAERARNEAERARISAQGVADAARIQAEGEAQATLIRAEAEAEALRMINEVLQENPQLILYRYVDLLADNVRLIILPADSPFLFDLQSLESFGGGNLLESLGANEAGAEGTGE